MSWNKIVTADSVIQRLYEDKGLYQLCNRSYDSLCVGGASSVRRPKLASLTVKKNTGTSSTSSDRKNAKSDTTMVETDLDVYAVPIASEVAARFESNDFLRREYEKSMALALKRQFNIDVIAAAQATTNISPAAAATIGWADYVSILKHYEDNQVPEEGRVIVTSSALMQEFYSIDVIKTAVGFNKDLLEKGMGNQMLGANWFISGLVPQIGGKDCIVSWYSQGLAFILSNQGEIKEVYDNDNLKDVIDLVAHAAAELDGDEFAKVIKHQ